MVDSRRNNLPSFVFIVVLVVVVGAMVWLFGSLPRHGELSQAAHQAAPGGGATR